MVWAKRTNAFFYRRPANPNETRNKCLSFGSPDQKAALYPGADVKCGKTLAVIELSPLDWMPTLISSKNRLPGLTRQITLSMKRFTLACQRRVGYFGPHERRHTHLVRHRAGRRQRRRAAFAAYL